MKNFLIFVISLATLCSFNTLQAQTDIVNIPDANLKEALLDHTPVIDTNGDGEISVEEAEAFEGYLDLKYKSISDLTGIEAFINIKRLVLSFNSIQGAVDFSANTKLERLLCRSNNISSINVTANTELKRLDVAENDLQELDLSGNNLIERLWVFSNQLSVLDISNMQNLEHLMADNNKFMSLDVSQNENLLTLGVYYNNLTSIDISNNPNLYLLNAWNNKLTSANVANGNNANVSRMKIHNNPDLTCIQHDEGFDPASKPCTNDEGWCKDETAEWSTNCTVNVEELLLNNTEIYPNPAKNNVTIILKNTDFLYAEVYNIQGAQVLSSTQQTFNVQGLKAGVYFVRIVNKDGAVIHKKLIKE